MKKFAIATAAILALIPATARAEDSFAIEQCINILSGLNALNYVGQQLNDQAKPSPDAKQYKLGAARVTIALDVAALTPVQTAAITAQQGFIRELPPLPAAEHGKPDSPERVDAAQEQNKAAQINWQKIIREPCNVHLGHLKIRDLKIGDGADDNQFPVSVLAAILPIVDDAK